MTRGNFLCHGKDNLPDTDLTQLDLDGPQHPWFQDLLLEIQYLRNERAEGPDPIVQTVTDRFHKRSREGMVKYGMSMADNPADAGEWLVNLQEELMDAVLYTERLKKEMN